MNLVTKLLTHQQEKDMWSNTKKTNCLKNWEVINLRINMILRGGWKKESLWWQNMIIFLQEKFKIRWKS